MAEHFVISGENTPVKPRSTSNSSEGSDWHVVKRAEDMHKIEMSKEDKEVLYQLETSLLRIIAEPYGTHSHVAGFALLHRIYLWLTNQAFKGKEYLHEDDMIEALRGTDDLEQSHVLSWINLDLLHQRKIYDAHTYTTKIVLKDNIWLSFEHITEALFSKRKQNYAKIPKDSSTVQMKSLSRSDRCCMFQFLVVIAYYIGHWNNHIKLETDNMPKTQLESEQQKKTENFRKAFSVFGSTKWCPQWQHNIEMPFEQNPEAAQIHKMFVEVFKAFGFGREAIPSPRRNMSFQLEQDLLHALSQAWKEKDLKLIRIRIDIYLSCVFWIEGRHVKDFDKQDFQDAAAVQKTLYDLCAHSEKHTISDRNWHAIAVRKWVLNEMIPNGQQELYDFDSLDLTGKIKSEYPSTGEMVKNLKLKRSCDYLELLHFLVIVLFYLHKSNEKIRAEHGIRDHFLRGDLTGIYSDEFAKVYPGVFALEKKVKDNRSVTKSGSKTFEEFKLVRSIFNKERKPGKYARRPIAHPHHRCLPMTRGRERTAHDAGFALDGETNREDLKRSEPAVLRLGATRESLQDEIRNTVGQVSKDSRLEEHLLALRRVKNPVVNPTLVLDLLLRLSNSHSPQTQPQKESLASNSDRLPPQSTLTSSLLNLLLDLPSPLLRFSSSGSGLRCSGNQPKPALALATLLANTAVHYRYIASYIPNSDPTSQAIAAHIQKQLGPYYSTLALLQGCENPPSLIRLRTRLLHVQKLLQSLAKIVAEVMDKNSSQALSAIYNLTAHGDPSVIKLAEDLLKEASRPFFSALSLWLSEGKTESGFFVQSSESAGLRKNERIGLVDSVGEEKKKQRSATEWSAKWSWKEEDVPGFVSLTLGRKIFSAGKSGEFVRLYGDKGDSISSESEVTEDLTLLSYTEKIKTRNIIDSIFISSSSSLRKLFFQKFKLTDHLRALKGFFFLAHGDFSACLLESLSSILSKPAVNTYKHHLTDALDAAFQYSAAALEPIHVKKALDTNILPSPAGTLGWDAFTLEYTVEAPLNAVLDPHSMRAYKRVFRHLWRTKRVGKALTDIWTTCTLSPLKGDWHEIRMALAEMTHFQQALQSYYALEVIECSWSVLEAFFNKNEGDLDALIQHHRAYVDRVVGKILLVNPQTGKSELDVLNQIMQAILNFYGAVSNLDSYYVSVAARLPSVGGVSQADSTRLENISLAVQSAANSFRLLAASLVKTLTSHADLDVRFLSVRLDFNGYYRSAQLALKANKAAAAAIAAAATAVI